jgi:hypothetical protein
MSRYSLSHIRRFKIAMTTSRLLLLTDLAELLERLTANVVGATVLGWIPASSYTVESEGRQMKQ